MTAVSQKLAAQWSEACSAGRWFVLYDMSASTITSLPFQRFIKPALCLGGFDRVSFWTASMCWMDWCCRRLDRKLTGNWYYSWILWGMRAKTKPRTETCAKSPSLLLSPVSHLFRQPASCKRAVLGLLSKRFSIMCDIRHLHLCQNHQARFGWVCDRELEMPNLSPRVLGLFDHGSCSLLVRQIEKK